MIFTTINGQQIDTSTYPFKEGVVMEKIEDNPLRSWANDNNGMYFIWGAWGNTSHSTFNFHNQKGVLKFWEYLASWVYNSSKGKVRLYLIDKSFGFWKNLRGFIKSYFQK